MAEILVDFGKLKKIYTGLGQISLQYASELANLKNSKHHFTFLVPDNFTDQFGNSISYKTLSFFNRHFSAINKKYDLWHAIHQDSEYFPAKETPYLLTIHDLNFLEEKSPAKAQMRLRRLQKKVNRASAITFISNFTEKTAKQNLTINVPSFVIYNGVNISAFRSSQEPDFLKNFRTDFNKQEPLFFAVGVIKEKKNFQVLIQFLKLLKNGILVIAGDDTDSYAGLMRNEIKSSGLEKRIIMPGNVSDIDRAWLYENCDAFFFPSRIEGFGLPVIEAMSYGKPVFLSTCSSLPEIGGDDAYYWENFNPDYMADIFNEKIKSSMTVSKVNSRKKRAAFFNWGNAVKSYLELYEKIIHHRL
ncbi:MAG: glycosyltransferase family 4 protein [Spirochaetia bacterium]|nr:glycosyltransferase family 4 protein [Spirochaetia bacterium]